MADTRMMRWRAQLSIAAAVVVAGWWFYSGGPSYVIQIDYQWVREVADSAEVVIDGEVVGMLEFDPRARPVRGFEVEPGEHVVELRSRHCDARPETVMVETSRLHVLIADLDETFRGCTIVFR